MRDTDFSRASPEAWWLMIWSPTCLLAGLVVLGLTQIEQNLFHGTTTTTISLSKLKLHHLVSFSVAEPVIREAVLFAAHQPSFGLPLRPHFSSFGHDFPESPYFSVDHLPFLA